VGEVRQRSDVEVKQQGNQAGKREMRRGVEEGEKGEATKQLGGKRVKGPPKLK